MVKDANDLLRKEGCDGLRYRFDQAERLNGAGDAPPDHNVQTSRIRLVRFCDIKLGRTARYLVKGLVPRTGLVIVWGPPKCGKSFWVFDVMMHVALGWNYRGRRIEQGPVVYCAFEGQSGFEARVEAFRQRHLGEHCGVVPFYLQPATIDLRDKHKELIAVIREQLRDKRPVAVVLDTLNRSLRGSESSDEDMSAYVKAADVIREAFDCAVIVVHHCGIDGGRPRGHTSLTGAADAQLSVKRDSARNIVVTLECAKDGAEGDRILSGLETLEVGTDENGETITSCFVIEVNGTQAAPKQKMNDKQRKAMSALHDILTERGVAPSANLGLPGGIVAVTLAEWRNELFRRGDLDKTGPNPRQDFKRLHEQLKARGLIGERDRLIWAA